MKRSGQLTKVLFVSIALASFAQAEGPRVPLLDLESTWKRLPQVESGGGVALPSWARALADSLPRTTAAMLDLDRLHRTKSPLEPILRGKLRWVVADANRCDYSKAYAISDLRRAGLAEAEIASLDEGAEGGSDAERLTLRFARQMTLKADEVTDDAVASLKRSHGEEKLTAIVLLIAAANFQDRLVLALGLRLEPGEPLAPVDVRFAKGGPNPEVPKRVIPDGVKPSVPTHVNDPEWMEFDFRGLQERLTGQRDRPGRIRVPSWDEVLARLPSDAPNKRPVRIQWSLVCMGYQPELALAWSACTRAFGEEARQDRVFEESLFWVVTRQIHCFY